MGGDPRRDARRDHPRLRQPALHHGPGGRGARAGDGRQPRRRARHRRLVRHRRAAARADGARHRARRRGRHQHLFVLRDRRRHRARRRAAGARGHRSGHASTSIRQAVAAAITPRTKAIMPVHLYGLCADMDSDRTSRRAAPACRSSRTPRRRSAPRIGAGRPAGSASFGCFSFFPSKNLGAFGDAGLVTTQRRRRLPRACGCCATTAPSRSTTTTSSAATSGWTRCRPRCCASRRRTSTAGPSGAARNADAVSRAVPRGRPRRARDAAGRSRRLPSHLQPVRDPRARARRVKRHSTRAASATRSTTRCRSTCRRASRISATRPARFRTPSAPRARRLALPIYGELTDDAAGGRRRRAIGGSRSTRSRALSPCRRCRHRRRLTTPPAGPHDPDLHRPAARHRGRLRLARRSASPSSRSPTRSCA